MHVVQEVDGIAGVVSYDLHYMLTPTRIQYIGPHQGEADNTNN